MFYSKWYLLLKNVAKSTLLSVGGDTFTGEIRALHKESKAAYTDRNSLKKAALRIAVYRP